MTIRRRLTLSTMLVLSMLLLFVAGCAPEVEEPEPDDPGEVVDDEPSSITIGLSMDPRTSDIHDHGNTLTEAVWINVFDYLVFRDHNMELQPSLATAWENIDDHTWRFELRQGVEFHNGEPFDAESVKFTLERVSGREDLSGHSQYRNIASVEIIDEYTVDIITHEPEPILLNRLSRIGSGMLPPKYFQDVGEEAFMDNLVGTGPYRFVEWSRDDFIKMEAFENHWRGKPDIDELVFRCIPEDATRMTEFLTEEIDIMCNVPPYMLDQVTTDFSRVPPAPTYRVLLWYVRVHDEYKTSDLRIRKAIDHSINRTQMIEEFLMGGGTPTRSRTGPGMFGFNPDLFDVDIYDPDRAQELLADAGYPDSGPAIGLLAMDDRFAVDSDSAMATTAHLEAVGFEVDAQIMSNSAAVDLYRAGGHPELRMQGLTSSLFDAQQALTGFLSQYYDRYGVSDLEFDRRVHAAEFNMDLDERERQLQELLEYVSDQRWYICLFNMDDFVAVHNRVDWEPRMDEYYWMYAASVK